MIPQAADVEAPRAARDQELGAQRYRTGQGVGLAHRR